MKTTTPKPQRPRKNETDASFCRRMGWGPGTVIEGTNVYGDVARLEITAIGERKILVKEDGYESGSWMFDERSWIEVRHAKRRAAKT